MAATPSIDMSGWLHEQLAQASPDLLRAMVTTFAESSTRPSRRSTTTGATPLTPSSTGGFPASGVEHGRMLGHERVLRDAWRAAGLRRLGGVGQSRLELR
jgi:hypothetical protein